MKSHRCYLYLPRTCLITFTYFLWTFQSLSIDCDHPPVIAHSSVLVDGTRVNDMAVYMCDIGYQLPDGSTVSQIQCSDTGAWLPITDDCIG